MNKLIPLALLLTGGAVSAQDDKAPPLPSPGGYTPSTTPAPPAASGLTETQIARIVDEAVSRAMNRQAAQAPTASAQAAYAPATASPQSFTQPAPVQVVQYATMQPAQTINVLVPPGPCHRAMARLGEHLVQKGSPKLKSMTIAPQASVPTYTITPAAPVAVTPAQYTPTTPPASFVQVQPQQAAPVKASMQR